MSESEGTKELTGIARSIEALFSTPTGPVDAGLDAPLDPPNPGPDRRVEAPALPDVTEAQDDTGPEPSNPGPLPLAGDPEPDEPPPLADDEVPSQADERAPWGEEPLPPSDASVAESPTPAPDESDEAEEPPTPLDVAVEAYVAGDHGKAAEIEALAEEHLERRELDPVARAVGRLAIAAGDPPDSATLEVALTIGSPVVYGRLARRIGTEREEERRREYFLACRNLGEPMGVAIRDDLAESTDRLARRIHCEALVEMGPAGRTIIEAMAVDENRFLVRNAVAILGDTGGAGAVELVTSALANPDARVRREALRSLAKLGDEASGELIVGLLEDPDREVQIAAAVAAGELQVERALRYLVKMIDDTSDADEVAALMRALGHLGDPGAVASIEKHIVPKLFHKPSPDLRIVGYRALHQIGTPHARRLLNQAVDDKDPRVKAAVKEMLGMR